MLYSLAALMLCLPAITAAAAIVEYLWGAADCQVCSTAHVQTASGNRAPRTANMLLRIEYQVWTRSFGLMVARLNLPRLLLAVVGIESMCFSSSR